MNDLLEQKRRPDITFCRNGRIFVTARVVRMLSMQPGDSINILHDDDGEFLLYAEKHVEFGRFVAQCYPTKRGSKNFGANSATLCRLVLQAARAAHNRVSFYIGKPFQRNDRTFIPIITRNPL